MAKKITDSKFKAIQNEIQMAEAVNREELEPMVLEFLHRYIGDYVPAYGSDWDIIINEIYPIIQNNLPSIFFRNPRAFLKPRNKTFITRRRNPLTQEMEEVQADSTKSAQTQEHILNYSLTKMRYKDEVRKTLLDALLFPYGVMWHGYKGDFGMTEERSIFIRSDEVFVSRLSPMRFIKDPAVTMSNLHEARWMGRIIDIPLQDLVEDNVLDVDPKKVRGFDGFGDRVGQRPTNKKEKVPGGMDTSNPASRGTGKSLLSFTDEWFRKSSFSKFVKVYELYIRPTKAEKRKGDRGTILVTTFEQDRPLRVSNWTIKAEGWPGHVLEFNPVPDRLFGIADVDTYKAIADQKNVITNLQIRNAQENTKVWVGLSKAGADEEDIQKVCKGENTVVIFEDGKPSERMFVASPGGQASSELYIIDQRIQKNLEDKSGVTDLKRGFLQSGEESAASVKLRAAGGSARPLYRQDIMSDFLKKSLNFINDLNKQFMPVKEAVRIVGSLDIEWSEAPTKEEIQADVDVDLDVVSMLPENPEKELEELTRALALMLDGIRDPAVATKLQQEGKVLNLSPLIEQMLLRLKIRNPEIFRNIKPEESQGFVSVQQVREAKDNVAAALRGQNPPHPPSQEDDHRAKLEVYSTIQQLLKEAGQVSDLLNQLIEIQTALLQESQEKEARPGASAKLPKPSVETIGAGR